MRDAALILTAIPHLHLFSAKHCLIMSLRHKAATQLPLSVGHVRAVLGSSPSSRLLNRLHYLTMRLWRTQVS